MDQLSLDAEFEAANALALEEVERVHTGKGDEPRALSVSDAVNLAKGTLEQIHLTIVGEVSGFTGLGRYAGVYFDLSDDNAKLSCMIWATVFKSLGVDLKNGMLVQVSGKFSVYPKRGSMQFQVSRIEPVGEGQIRVQIAQIQARLRAEGLMDAARKQPIPVMPEKIAVVTSPHGDAVHDVLRTLRRRFPVARVLFFGTQVEGEAAAPQIVAALEAADAAGAEVVLLVRGGGSFDALLPFSTEEVARTIADMQTPVVTGIGHEPDTATADHVADLRASTPTAAAEAVSPDRMDLESVLIGNQRALARALKNSVVVRQANVARLRSRPLFTSPETLLWTWAQTVANLGDRLTRAIPGQLHQDRTNLTRLIERFVTVTPRLLEDTRHRLSTSAARLDDLSPLKVLGRGYAAAFDEDTGAVIDSIKKVAVHDRIKIHVSDGTINATVTDRSES
jgi:exodeoxyribonuclease VII large subunit